MDADIIYLVLFGYVTVVVIVLLVLDTIKRIYNVS